MFSSNSQFSYSLLNQSDQHKDVMDLLNLEKQYQQNITFLREQIRELDQRIAMGKTIHDGYCEYEIKLNAELFELFKGIKIYNPESVNPKVGHLQENIRKIKLSIAHATKINFELFTTYSETLKDLNAQQAGLATTRLKLESFQHEAITDDEQQNTYQPPRLL